MTNSDDPRHWPEERWQALALKVAAHLDGLTAAQADKVLQIAGNMVALSATFRVDTPVFQDMVKGVLCDLRKG